ncbi:hypothetical protein [Methylobacterium oryzihabitans]|uniref:Uncharacterized protein n=1 Tax=Methylobacterium oryzihabitans TaxID=2499852 RepID=A0A437NYE5_9HYPH|nr:hypothetical protein [Methylobacterium oryzihabitans]RVU15033.1 hypothetical protein EOE48_20725 [Methylobacterium oryzihabitans]
MPPHHRPTTSGLRVAVKPLRSFRTGYDPVLNGVAHGLGDLFPPVPHPEPVRPDDPRVAASVERSRTA